MANDEMPRVVKIGATLRCPEDRLNDARSTTWAPTCYRIIAQALVEDAFAAEQALHALLAHRRLSPGFHRLNPLMLRLPPVDAAWQAVAGGQLPVKGIGPGHQLQPGQRQPIAVAQGLLPVAGA